MTALTVYEEIEDLGLKERYNSVTNKINSNQMKIRHQERKA